MKALLTLLMCFLPLSFAAKGIRVSALTNAFSCISNQGYDFATVRGYTKHGNVDPNVITNIKNAKNGEFRVVDVYLSPCASCGDAKGQVDALVSTIKGESIERIWVEVAAYEWPSNQLENQDFILIMMDTIKRHGKETGILTSLIDWQTIVGDWKVDREFPLWYVDNDDADDFRDYQPFGGWYRPYIKQYAGSYRLCDVTVDLNFK